MESGTVCRRKAIKSGTFGATAAPWAEIPAAFRLFQYPVLTGFLQAKWQFTYELTEIAAVHNRCDVTAGPNRGTLLRSGDDLTKENPTHVPAIASCGT